MQLPRLFITTIAAIITALSCAAQTNLITNGTFESWDRGMPSDWKFGADASKTSIVKQVEGLGSGSSVLVQNKAHITQATSLSPKSFMLSFNFTLNQDPLVSEFSQSFIINLYQTPALMDSGKAWISLRFQSNNVSTAPFSLWALNDSSGWQSLTGAVFEPSILKEDNVSLAEAKQYQLVLAFNSTSNTYVISYTPQGGKTTTLKPVAHFRNATTHAGLKGLQFYSNNSGFALDNVTVNAAR